MACGSHRRFIAPDRRAPVPTSLTRNAVGQGAQDTPLGTFGEVRLLRGACAPEPLASSCWSPPARRGRRRPSDRPGVGCARQWQRACSVAAKYRGARGGIAPTSPSTGVPGRAARPAGLGRSGRGRTARRRPGRREFERNCGRRVPRSGRDADRARGERSHSCFVAPVRLRQGRSRRPPRGGRKRAETRPPFSLRTAPAPGTERAIDSERDGAVVQRGSGALPQTAEPDAGGAVGAKPPGREIGAPEEAHRLSPSGALTRHLPR